MRRYLVLTLLITGYWILHTLALPSPSLAQGNSSCDQAGEPCCPSRTGGACLIGTGLICVGGTCRDPASLPDTSQCDAETETCCTDPVTGNPFCISGLVCRTGTCQRTPPAGPPGSSGSDPFCNAGDPESGINTAIGCLFADQPTMFVGQLLRWGVGVGGGIAFLLIVYAGFMIATAAGDPKRVQAGRELLMSALGGLILIVLSVLLLNFIGVDILGLSNLGFKV